MVMLERWHFPMLNDRDRNEKYKKAISKKIKVGGKQSLPNQPMKSFGD